MKLPDPPTFSGGDNDSLVFTEYIVRIEGKLEGNTDHFNNERMKLVYLVSRITGEASRHVGSRISTDGPVDYQIIGDLLDHLKEFYDDPDKKNKAR